VIKSNKRHLACLALSPIVLGLFASSTQAATLVDLHHHDVASLNAAYASVTAGIGKPSVAAERHAEFLGLDKESSLRALSSNRDADGSTHYRYQQSFRGIPVWGEHVVVTEGRDGTVKNLFGRSVADLAADLSTNARTRMTSASALAAAKVVALGKGQVTQREESTQMIFVGDDNVARMAFVVSFVADAPRGGSPSRPVVIIDALSGAVLKHFDGLTTSLVGTGPGGNTKTGQYEWGSGGKYGFLDVTQSGTTCTMNNTDVKTVNLNGGTTSTTAFAYTCPRNTVKAINGAYSPLNDAHFFGGVIQNMYSSYVGVKALTFQLVMRTHYSSSYENAFWDGTTMSFGDGASTFYPLVSVDVAGHEVSHGFTEQHSNLTYSGQSGGMNEAYSDMGGEATEYFWKGTNDFLVGPEVFKATGALRYMCNPTQDGGSIDNAANYTSSLDVHYSSGVYNKAFCTLAKKTGWDTVKAFKAFARANQNYWTPSSTFNSGACGVETAATDLGFTKADVTAAFTAVGVACPGGGGGGGGGSTGGALTKGVTVTGISQATAGSDVTYTLAVPAGSTNLKFTMSGGTGDADMYVKAGSAPTDTVYDCRPYTSGNAESCTIAAPVAGTYYVRLKAYAAFSGVSLLGDYTVGGGGGGGGTVLTSGVPVSLASVATNGVSPNYTLVVPAGKTSVVFTISGGTGDADLYVKSGSAPTTTSYTCRPYLSGNAETCTISAPAAGTYYVNVRAYAAYTGVTLKGTIN
jgi:Zn-dependent metalloprotease